MDARINHFENPTLVKFAKYINSAGRVISESTLPATTQELVKLRASQINGCAFCTDMHAKDAAAAGESQLRLNLVATWRKRRSSLKPSEPPLRWLNRAPASPTPPAVSLMGRGRTPPSTMTKNSSGPWWRSSR